LRAKCRVCGTPLDTNTAYKVTTYDANNKEKRAYYCSEEEYNKDEENKQKAAQDRDKVYRLVCEIFGVNEILNTALWKEKVVWNKAFSDEIIAQYLTENKQWLINTISNLDSGEYGKIRYLSAILKNRLADFMPKTLEDETQKQRIQVDDGFYETSFNNTHKRRALADLEDEF
jgi:hypothetical protein